MTSKHLIGVDEVNTHSIPTPHNHPSVIQRKKLEEARKQRLTKALRNNLKKRKEQVRARLAESAP